MDGIINMKPSHLKFNRLVRIISGFLCVALAVNIAINANHYFNARHEAEIIEKSNAYSEINSLRISAADEAGEREQTEALLEMLSAPATEPDLDIILKTAKTLNVSILLIDGGCVTGFALSFDAAAEFINRLSTELGKEVNIINISRLEFPGGATGFELKI